MRETATLTRPAPRVGSWQEPRTQRLPTNRSILFLGILFLVGLAFGWGVTHVLWPSAPGRVSEVDYVAVVAQLFERDHNALLAQDRLAVFGSPSDLVQQALQAARDGQVTSADDRSALEVLAQALGAAPSAGPVATNPSAPPATSGDAGGHASWVGPLIAFVLALALGAAVLLRTAGLSMSLAQLPRVSLPNLTVAVPTTRWPRVSSRPTTATGSRRESFAERSESGATTDLDLDDVVPSPAPISGRGARGGAAPPRVGAVARPRRPTTFESSYRLGDDPFDEVYPITDPTTGALVAACGLSAVLKLDPLTTGHYCAFSAWLHDYVGGDDLHAAGLVAPGALDVARGQIERWVRGGQIDTILSLERGATARIGAARLAATVTVVDVQFGRDASPESYVTQLTVRYEIHADASSAAEVAD